jgi:hypothetical protein
MAVPISPDNPMRTTLRVTLGFWAVSAILLVIGIVALSVWGSNGGPGVVGILACTWGALGVVLCPIFMIPFRRAARTAEDVMTGQAKIARWSCTPEEWTRFVAIETKVPKTTKRVIILLVLVPVVLVFIFIIASASRSGPAMGAGVWAMIIGTMFGTLGLIFGLAWFGRWLHLRWLRHARDHLVYIGTRGVVLGGQFNSFEQLGAQLEKVRYDPGDPGLMVFQWLQPGAGMYALPVTMSVTVPVPKASDAEAHRVVEAFKNQFKPPKEGIS